MDPNKYLLLLLVFLFPPRIISQIDRSGSENSNIVLLVADNILRVGQDTGEVVLTLQPWVNLSHTPGPGELPPGATTHPS